MSAGPAPTVDERCESPPGDVAHGEIDLRGGRKGEYDFGPRSEGIRTWRAQPQAGDRRKRGDPRGSGLAEPRQGATEQTLLLQLRGYRIEAEAEEEDLVFPLVAHAEFLIRLTDQTADRTIAGLHFCKHFRAHRAARAVEGERQPVADRISVDARQREFRGKCAP